VRTAAAWRSRPSAATPSDEGTITVALIGSDGPAGTATRRVAAEGLDLQAAAVLTTGIVDGIPSALLTDGADLGVLFGLEGTGAPRILRSAPGTCPLILPGGEGLYGEPPDDRSADTPRYAVTDVLHGDFNRDGAQDLAWAGPASMACLLSGRDDVMLDPVEGSTLQAWGFLDGRYGLGGLWASPDGRLSWRKLLWSGFQQLPAGGVALAGYSGRMVSAGGVLAGVRDGRLEYSVSGAYPAPGSSVEGGVPFDLDGAGAMDAAVLADGSVTLIGGPSGDDPSTLRLTVTTTTASGETLLTGVRTVPSGSAAIGDGA